MEYWNPRIAPFQASNAPIRSLAEGMVSLQSENGEVWFRGAHPDRQAGRHATGGAWTQPDARLRGVG